MSRPFRRALSTVPVADRTVRNADRCTSWQSVEAGTHRSDCPGESGGSGGRLWALSAVSCRWLAVQQFELTSQANGPGAEGNHHCGPLHQSEDAPGLLPPGELA